MNQDVPESRPGLKDPERGTSSMLPARTCCAPTRRWAHSATRWNRAYNSTYHSLQTQLRKAVFSHGPPVRRFVYTFSKTMDNTSCAGQFCNDGAALWGTGSPQLFNGNRSLEKVRFPLTTSRNVFKFNYNWDLPFGRGKDPLSRRPEHSEPGDWELEAQRVGRCSERAPVSTESGQQRGVSRRDVGET